MNGGRPVVLVTGANGFIGRHLCPALARKGWAVRRAVRLPSSSADEVVIGALGPTTDWSAALVDIEAVVHLAARVHHPNEEQADRLYTSINTQGTLQLARCAIKAGVSKFIYVSTILVNGSHTDGRSPFRESDKITPRGVYGNSKAQAEAGLETLAEESPMRVIIVRPPLVYGPDAIGNFKHLVKAVQLGIPLPLSSINNRRAFISVQNLVSFISKSLSFATTKFEIYLVADSEQISTPELVRRIAKAMDERECLFPMPIKALEFLLRAMGRPEARESLIGSMEVDISHAMSTGWKPEYSMDEGLKMALTTFGRDHV